MLTRTFSNSRVDFGSLFSQRGYTTVLQCGKIKKILIRVFVNANAHTSYASLDYDRFFLFCPAPASVKSAGQKAKPDIKKETRGPKKLFQGTATGPVESVGASPVFLAIKAIAAVAFVGGGAYASSTFSKKYGSEKGKALDKEDGVPWKNGFTTSAENWNGRAAMLGFAGILVLELITGQGITTGLGLLE